MTASARDRGVVERVKLVSEWDEAPREIRYLEALDPGRAAVVSWSPPPFSGPRAVAYRGGTHASAAAYKMLTATRAQSGAEASWRVWTLPAGVKPGGFRRRQLAEDVSLLPPGSVVPWYLHRAADGWTLQHVAGGLTDTPDWCAQPWLLEALAG